MKYFLLTVAAAALALISPALAQESGTATGTTMLSGTGVTCGPQSAGTATGTSTDTTASSETSGSGTTSTETTASTSSTGTSTDTTASTSGTSAGTNTTTSTETTTGSTGTSTDTAATSGNSAETNASSTMALSADNKITADIARSALKGFSTKADKFGTLAAPSVVCIVDVDTLAASDTSLQSDISGAQTNNAQIKTTLEGNTAVMDVIKSQHPTFDINQVRAMDIGPKGELVLYVSRS